MTSESKSKKSEVGQTATVGVKGSVKSLQQLSSSARAAQLKRDGNRNERAVTSLEEALKTEAARGGSSSSGAKK